MVVNEMYEKLEQIWQVVTRCPTYNGYSIRSTAYPEFLEEFLKNYSHVKTHFMHSDVMYLDRYKAAAAIVFSMINVNVLDAKDGKNEDWIINSNKFALCTGLSYLQNEYNQECIQSGLQPIRRYSFPRVKEGTTPYLNTLIRMLYHVDTKEISNILPLASLFLTLEGYNLSGAK